jgi:hypothetical protein
MKLERTLLQACVVVGGFVPVTAGLSGALWGPAMMDAALSGAADSHWRYLSGLLLGIGLAFWSTVPRIESQTARFRLLTLIVFVGGVCRVATLHLAPVPSTDMLFAAAMEVVVTPLLCLWQWRVASRLNP